MISTRSFLKSAIQLYYKLSHGVTFQVSDKVPDSGPYIVASNHISNHDPVLLGAFLNDTIQFMAKEELFRIPVLRSIVKRLDAFPVRRTGLGIGAIRSSIRLLNAGGIVGVFPEGTRNRDGRELPCKPGVGFIATRANSTPIVPVAICAKKGRLLREFHIVVGDPIVPVDSDYRQLAQHVMQTIHSLKRSVNANMERTLIVQESVD